MIRLFLLLLAVFAAGLAAMLLLRPDTGYVLVNYGPWVVETSIAALLLALIATLAAGWFALRASGYLLRLPGNLREVVDRQREERAGRAFQAGLVATLEGHWPRAESELVRRAADHRQPLLNYLLAARAAQRQGNGERADHYLRLAARNAEGHELAVELVEAELRRERGDIVGARRAAEAVREREPQHPAAIETLAECLAALGEWGALRSLLVETEGSAAIAPLRREQLAVRALREQLAKAVADASLARLKGLWDAAGTLRERADLAEDYIAGLIRLNAVREAQAQIIRVLDARWQPGLVSQFGRIDGGDPLGRLAAVERWLTLWGERPELLQAAGRVCIENRLWGKAQSYLDAALAAAPTPAVHHELARLAIETRRPEAAAQHYRQGLELAAGSELR